MGRDLLETFAWCLAETRAWCQMQGERDDPVNSLRTPALRPACMEEEVTYCYEWGDGDNKQALLSTLSQKRAEALWQRGQYPRDTRDGTQGGRLLISSPEDSDVCGLSVAFSEGFIDDEDVPPWDTWFWYVEEAYTESPEYRRACNASQWATTSLAHHWLCWVPDAFVPLAEEGIAVNPMGCLVWASDYRKTWYYDTPTLRLLDAEGYLR